MKVRLYSDEMPCDFVESKIKAYINSIYKNPSEVDIYFNLGYVDFVADDNKPETHDKIKRDKVFSISDLNENEYYHVFIKHNTIAECTSLKDFSFLLAIHDKPFVTKYKNGECIKYNRVENVYSLLGFELELKTLDSDSISDAMYYLKTQNQTIQDIRISLVDSSMNSVFNLTEKIKPNDIHL